MTVCIYTSCETETKHKCYSWFFILSHLKTIKLLWMIIGWLLVQSLATGANGQELTVSFQSSTYNVPESQDTIEVCVETNIGNAEEFTVDIQSILFLLPNFATDGADFIGSRQTVMFPASNTSQHQCVDIEILDDPVVEGDEPFRVSYKLPPGVQRGTNPSTTVTIIDDDEVEVQFERSSYTVDEGSQTVEACFNTSTGTKQMLTVIIADAEKSISPNPATIDVDFLPIDSGQGKYSIPSSESGQTFCAMISIVDDDIALEGDEEFRLIFSFLLLLNGQVGVGTNNEACVTITDNDDVSVSFKETEIRVIENDTTVEVCVVSSNPVKGSFVVETATMNNTATAPDDYMAANASLTFEGYDQEECYPVTILDDEKLEGEEDFNNVFTNITDGVFTGTPETSRIVIEDDESDGCPPLTNEPIDSQFPNITFTWPETEIGNNVSYTCPCQNLTSTKESASVTGSRVCGGNYSDGALWDSVNVIEDCGLSTITLQLCQAQIILVNVTSAIEDIQALDILVATTLLEELIDEATSAENEEVRENFLRTIDNIIRADTEEVAQSQDIANTSARLLTVLNSFSDNVEIPNNTNSTTFIQTSYALRIANINVREFRGETLTLDLGSVDDAISGESVIDSNTITVVAGTEHDIQPAVTAAVRVPKSIFEEMGGINKSEVQRLSYSIFTLGTLFQSSDINQSNLTLGTVVVSIRVNGTRDTQTLTTPIEVLFQPSQLIENTTNTLCGHWDLTYNDGHGAWTTDSCVLVEEDTNTVGLANDESQTNNQRSRRDDQTPVTDEISSDDGENVMVHYSQPGHFGLLLDLTHGVVEPPPEVFSFVLQVISYVGLAISLVCLAIFLLTYLTTRQLRTNGHGQILINMSVALMGLYIMFLIGAHASPVPVLCSISAVLLQYFMLVFFAWTAVEAFFLYRKLVKVLGTHIPKFVLKGGLIAWLSPWIIVAVSVGPGYRSYYRDEMSPGFCRAIGLPFWLGTILPFVITYAFNWIMFVIIVVSLYRYTRNKSEMKGEKMDKAKFVKQQVLIAFGLATLFGLGWGFGLAASGTTVHGLTLAFQIIFSVFVGSQGVLFFLLHGIKKQEARNQWKLWFTTITRHFYGGSKTASATTDSKTTFSSYGMSTFSKRGTLSHKKEKDEESREFGNGTTNHTPTEEKCPSVSVKSDKMNGEKVPSESTTQSHAEKSNEFEQVNDTGQ